MLLSAALVAAGCSKNESGSSGEGSPTVKGSEVTAITTNSAKCGGEVLSEGKSPVAHRGLVWSKEETPTIELKTKTDEGRGTGSFTSRITGLESDTRYYVRAYTTGITGTEYGEVVSFVTEEGGGGSYPEAPELECITINGIVWAPVNCGYDAVNYPYGKLYQWGRKDGCGYKATDGTSSYNDKGNLLQITASGPVSASDEDASEFYKLSSSPWDWLSPQDSARWNSNLQWPGKETAPAKTEYDPCPDGWRVPTAGELESLLGSHTTGGLQDGTGVHSGMKGKWFDGSTSSAPSSGVFLPAAGGRNSLTGSAFSRGSYGSYWSSSVSGYYAWGLLFGSGSADMGNGGRAFGFSVRCVQE